MYTFNNTLSISQVVDILDISTDSVKRYIKQRCLPANKFNGIMRIY